MPDRKFSILPVADFTSDNLAALISKDGKDPQAGERQRGQDRGFHPELPGHGPADRTGHDMVCLLQGQER